MDFRQYKKIPCPMCEGRGRVHGRDCKRCNTEGEISVPVEDIEREEAWEAIGKSKQGFDNCRPTPLWCSVAGCNRAVEPFASCENCQYCDNKKFELARKKTQEAKADAGKPRLSLVPTQIFYDIARVREYGNKKYGDSDNWKTVEAQRYVDAMFRHLLAFATDPDGRDEESGLPHLWHLECNAAFLSEMMKGRWQ